MYVCYNCTLDYLGAYLSFGALHLFKPYLKAILNFNNVTDNAHVLLHLHDFFKIINECYKMPYYSYFYLYLETILCTIFRMHVGLFLPYLE